MMCPAEGGGAALPRVVHVSTFDQGGAARACLRLHQGLLKHGVESDVLVLYKTGDRVERVHDFRDCLGPIDAFGHKVHNKLINIRNALRLGIRPKVRELFSFADSCWDLHRHPLIKRASVIHLHWIAGFLDPRSFFPSFRNPPYSERKLIWTLHDFHPFSGGFHYPYGVDADPYRDLIDRNLQVQRVALREVSLEIVSPSRWLQQESLRSQVLARFPHHVVPNGLDSSIFRPLDREAARRRYDLSRDQRLLLFVSDWIRYPRKGAEVLIEALGILQACDVTVCLVGDPGGKKNPGIPGVRALGRIDDDAELAELYSAADLFVIPSFADNFPNTVVESLCCGTPVAAFETGGIPEMIDQGRNGFLTSDRTASGLARLLDTSLDHCQRLDSTTVSAEAHSRYSDRRQADEYLQIYGL